ncbi:MAG: hypothetical protein KAQ85_02290 [Thermodesulfovibrionia bacterium]|nr:hypothetical protein [Thermodesulfovibrionia bacterium]
MENTLFIILVLVIVIIGGGFVVYKDIVEELAEIKESNKRIEENLGTGICVDERVEEKSGVQTKCVYCMGKGLEIHEGAPGCPVEQDCGNCSGTGWCDG